MMRGFVAGEVDILVSTMIVESGLDVPNANDGGARRAPLRPGAALPARGRVGRSHRRAYILLLVPDAIDADAEERLRVLEHHTDLGAGYRIALKDLEIRGAEPAASMSGHAHAAGSTCTCAGWRRPCATSPGPGRPSRPPRRTWWGWTGRPISRTATCPTTTSSSTCTADWRGRSHPAKLMGCEMNCASASAPTGRGRDPASHGAPPCPGRALGLQHVLIRETRRGSPSGRAPSPGSPASHRPWTTCSWRRRCAARCRSRFVSRLGGEPIVPALVRALQKAA